MMTKIGYLVIVLGLVTIIAGGAFIGLGTWRASMLEKAMQQEQITLGIEGEELAPGEFIDTAKEAEVAGDTVRTHRHSIAPTYGDLLGDGRFDPTDPDHLTYGQALNLENYLYLAVLGFGVTQLASGAGAVMIAIGVAIGFIGLAVLKLARKNLI